MIVKLNVMIFVIQFLQSQINFKMSDYVIPGKRKSKTDKRAKARYNRYKKGGSKRSDKNKPKQEK